MAVTVTANDRTVVHRASDGFALGFPDACFTPQPNVPIPYLNLAISADAAGTCTTVFCDGYPVMKESSFLARSYADEAGKGGGVLSGCNEGKASFFTFSYDVRFEGECVPRHLDGMLGNHGSPFNLLEWILQFGKAAGIRALLCFAFCMCNFKRAKGPCFNKMLGEEIDSGVNSAPFWDPRFPGVWLEVPYDMTKRPPRMFVSNEDSKHQTDGGNPPKPLKLPWHHRAAGWRTEEGDTEIPDVVVAKDSNKIPLTKDNIEKIYEIKFDGDPRGSGPALKEQLEQQRKICRNVEVLNKQTCLCPRPQEANEDNDSASKEKDQEAEKQKALKALDDFLKDQESWRQRRHPVGGGIDPWDPGEQYREPPGPENDWTGDRRRRHREPQPGQQPGNPWGVPDNPPSPQPAPPGPQPAPPGPQPAPPGPEPGPWRSPPGPGPEIPPEWFFEEMPPAQPGGDSPGWSEDALDFVGAHQGGGE